MNILYINHYAGSRVHGMEFRPWYMAKRWARDGHRVTIAASSYSHLRTENPGLGGKKFAEQTLDGIRYFWIAGPAYRGNGIGRIRNMLSFLRGLYRYERELTEPGPPDAVIASSTYPLDIYPARHIAEKYGAALVYEVHDLWPLSPIELGGMSPRHPYIVLMQAAENFCYRHSDRVVSLLPNAKEHMVEHGMAPEKFVYVPNGIERADWEKPFGDPPVYGDVLAEYHQAGEFLIGYAGAHGIANALDSFVEAGELLRGKGIRLILVGPGPERGRLMQKAKDKGLDDVVTFLPPVGRAQVPELLSQMDALYVGLQRQPLFRFGVSPNKLMDYMMAAKPVIFAIDAPNDMVAEARCGVSIPPEDSEAIARAAERLASLPKEELAAMGRRGREYILQNNEYDVLSRRFLDALRKK